MASDLFSKRAAETTAASGFHFNFFESDSAEASGGRESSGKKKSKKSKKSKGADVSCVEGGDLGGDKGEEDATLDPVGDGKGENDSKGVDACASLPAKPKVRCDDPRETFKGKTGVSSSGSICVEETKDKRHDASSKTTSNNSNNKKTACNKKNDNSNKNKKKNIIVEPAADDADFMSAIESLKAATIDASEHKKGIGNAGLVKKDLKNYFVSKNDSNLDNKTKQKLKFGFGKNLVAVGKTKVRDANWLTKTTTGAFSRDSLTSSSAASKKAAGKASATHSTTTTTTTASAHGLKSKESSSVFSFSFSV